MIKPPHQSSVVPILSFISHIALVACILGATTLGAYAQSRFEFLAPPSTSSNRIYRVDTQTGAMGVCWFNGTITECMTGSGLAGPQERGLYTLRRSESGSEKGVFRVDLNTGAVSNCWIKQGVLTCTFPQR